VQFKYWTCVALGLTAMISTMCLQASTLEEQAILMPVHKIMDGVAQRNHAMVKEQLLPGGMATLIREGKPLQLHFDAFVERLPTTGATKLEERLYDPLVHIDHDIAVVWVPYKFFIDDKVDHCGTDVFSLIHQDGRWLVSGIADNSRKDCLSK
jgi:hypothetical protein